MQAVWITPSPDVNDTPPKGVIVLAVGWAGSDELVRHLELPEGYDLLCLFDYRTLALDIDLTAMLAPYAERHLVAWSFGVWAANRLFSTHPFDNTLKWATATAVNGTPIPISDTYGIPERAFAVTLRSIGGAGTQKFLERMCGTPEILQFYYRHRSTRTLGEIYDELVQLRRQTLPITPSQPAKNFWTAAVIGGGDAIFPPENMAAYWNEAQIPATVIPQMPHYPFYQTELLTTLIPHEAR